MQKSDDVTRNRAHMPEGTQTILNARSLDQAHARLSQLLYKGHKVLDIGCGTGAITRGIAEAVTEEGQVIGVDVNSSLIQEAIHTHDSYSHLTFQVGDIYQLPFQDHFDIVTAARVLQWLEDPFAAIKNMVKALKPGGTLIILDYNHEKIKWHPNPPKSMQTFYDAFLKWRSEAGMDNTISDHLSDMFSKADLIDVTETPQHEITNRGDSDFAVRIGIWADVAASRGHQIVKDGFLDEEQRATADSDYRSWIHDGAQSQSMHLIAVEGIRPL